MVVFIYHLQSNWHYCIMWCLSGPAINLIFKVSFYKRKGTLQFKILVLPTNLATFCRKLSSWIPSDNDPKKLKLKFKIGSSTCFQMKPQKHFVTQNFQSNISSKFTRNKNLCFWNSKYVQHDPTFLMLGKKKKLKLIVFAQKKKYYKKEELINKVKAFFLVGYKNKSYI